MINKIARETIIDNNQVTLWFYPDYKIIHHKIHKFIYGEKFQELLLSGLEYLKNNNCTKWLSDDRTSSALRKSDTEWGDEVWAPQMMEAGWKYWAILMPDRVIGKMNMKMLIEKYLERGVEVEIFDDENKALEWLKAK